MTGWMAPRGGGYTPRGRPLSDPQPPRGGAGIGALSTPGGTRTHTDQNLNLVPLPIGLQEHQRKAEESNPQVSPCPGIRRRLPTIQRSLPSRRAGESNTTDECRTVLSRNASAQLRSPSRTTRVVKRVIDYCGRAWL